MRAVTYQGITLAILKRLASTRAGKLNICACFRATLR